MTTCPYCNQPATATIVSNPSRVCPAHALEFWSGLLDFAHARYGPCVRGGSTICTCPMCEELDLASARAFATASIGPSPGDHVGFVLRLAS